MHGMSINLSQRAQNQSISCNNSDGDMKQKKGPQRAKKYENLWWALANIIFCGSQFPLL